MRNLLCAVCAALFSVSPALAAETAPSRTSPTRVANLKGVNLDGAEYNGGLGKRYGFDYIYPSTEEIDHYASLGFGVIRLPFDLTRAYPTPYAALDPIQVGAIKTVLNDALKKGMRVVLDPHAFGYIQDTRSPATSWLIGRDAEGTKLFVDFWSKMAITFRSYPNVIFGLMNEPHDQTAVQWEAGAVPAIAAIRATGASQLILIPGTNWSAAYSWDTLNGPVWARFKDRNFAFEVHQYLDSDSSGTHPQCAVGVGAGRLAPTTAWAKAQGVKLFLGEFGWSADPTCPAEAKAFMNYLSANPDVWIGWTYWADGPWTGNYMFSPGPKNEIESTQMTELKKHL